MPEISAKKTRHKMSKCSPFMNYIDMCLTENHSSVIACYTVLLMLINDTGVVGGGGADVNGLVLYIL